ncbi:MAG: DegT/DnrJ/EryC1/StrS aminotransferase family protein, partial [Victivallales bacterium]|nr:DegT/DnrJ/EryC1/StrS aminotransferase family protein [Victivallales bacterium]
SVSFQQSKTLAAGESGICITNDDRLALRIYRAKHIGYPPASQQGQAATSPDEDLICHNYRGLAIPARILLDQLPGLDALLERYANFYKVFSDMVADIDGFKLQKPGRLATRQGYYSLGMVFSEDVWGKVSCQRLIDAFRAEGAGMGQTYGPVYSHVLFNMKPTDYRNDGCQNVEMLKRFGYRVSHQAMYHLENAEVFSTILHKLAANIKELEDLA